MNFTLGHAQCDATPTMGKLVHPEIHMTNYNTSKTMSTVYPIVSTLFYIVKIVVSR